MELKNKAVFGVGLILTLSFFSFWQQDLLKGLFLAIKGQRQLLSPLGRQPNQASSQILGQITTLENDYQLGELVPGQQVLAQGAYVYDLTRQKLIFQKEAQKQLPAASTIKIVTAAVALEKGDLAEELTVGHFPTMVGESSMNLGFGEKFTLEELLYGLLMVSGNDAAETIALGLAGNRQDYVSWMNDLITQAGAQNTHLTTPSGLDEEGQYTTAYDLYLLGNYIFGRYPEVLQISATQEKYLPKNSSHQAYLLKNKLLLWDDFQIIGGKAGLGEQSLLSLIAILDYHQRRILVSLIRTPSLRHDLDQLVKLF